MVNSVMANDFNLTPRDFVGRTDRDLFEPDMAEKYAGDDKLVIECGRAKNIIEDYSSPVGDTRRVHTVKSPIRDDKGDIIGIIGIFWDITECHQDNESLSFG